MSETAKLIHEILPVGMLQCNCHIIGDPRTLEGVVIDPGEDAGRILELIAKHNLRVTTIAITHAHIDHVGGLRKIQQATGAPVRMHADDLDLYKMLNLQAAWLGCKAPEQVNVDELLHDGDAIRWGGFQAQVLHTPGHTKGSICLYVPSDENLVREARVIVKPAEKTPGLLFAGDTLFSGSIGRTDLWGGSFDAIMRSLKGKLLELPDETMVYPGHGEVTTIGRERDTNPFLVAQ